jgi:calcineurin-like phosphoesterase family protein
MRNIWFISDTHFNHANILTFKGAGGNPVRPEFSDADHMNEIMIQRWNEVVRDGDIVYHLGDVVMGNNKEDWLAKNMPRLMGKKRLILGNHDDAKHFVGKGHFSKVTMWRMFNEFGILATHVPVHESTLGEHRFDGEMINVHGHIHENKSPKGPYRCVCVEQTDYYPISIDELRVK